MYDDFKVANYSKALLSPELFGRHLSRIFTGDVVDGLTVTPGTGMKVVLAPGNAFIRFGSAAVASARYVSLVNNFELSIGTADVSNPRIDLVVLYIDNAVSLPSGTPSVGNLDGKGVAKAKIVQGAPAATPAAPNATAIQSSVGSANPYTVVAQVRVDASVSVIASNKIVDVRSKVKLTASRIDSSVQSMVMAGGASSYPTGTSVAKYPTTLVTDPEGHLSYNPSTGRITVNTAGRYEVVANMHFATSGLVSGAYGKTDLFMNSTYVASSGTKVGSGDNKVTFEWSGSAIRDCVPGDYFVTYVNHGDANTRDLSASSTFAVFKT